MGILIFGGSFNPVHIGHLRLAIDASEIMGEEIQKVEFVPVANPPHKKTSTMLPFELRAEMIGKSIAAFPEMRCNKMESQRSGPSYSYDTLKIYTSLYPGQRLYFLLGSSDYAQLPTWNRWRELTELCTLLIAPRGNFSVGDFFELSASMYGNFRLDSQGTISNVTNIYINDHEKIIFMDIPWLDISATYVRKLWLEGRSIKYLVPAEAIKILENVSREVLSCWQER